MSFIQIQQRLVSHPKTLRLARLLGEDRYTTLGRLIALWLWCLDNAPNGVLDEDIDDKMLADVMGWSEEMGDPFDLMEALHTAGFIALAEDEAKDGAEDEAGERWRLVGWDELVADAAAPDKEPAGEEE